MATGNGSLVTEFILVGLTDQPELQTPLFFLFLTMYVITVLGNLGLITLIGLNSHLHTPMYFFLFNLSFIDFCYSSVFTPKMLMNFVLKENIISYMGCMTQLYFYLFFVISECYVLTSMAYDRYVAICNPLLYNTAMSPKLCGNFMLGSYLMAFGGATAHTGCMLRLTFCDANTINHYFCDLLPLLQLSCTSTYINEMVVFIVVGINIIVPSLAIFISYSLIISSILQISSTVGWSKAFSTCSSHMIAVSLFFGSGAFVYLKPSSDESVNKGKISSVFYTNVVPMMNPLIYSLRNKDVKVVLRKILSRRKDPDLGTFSYSFLLDLTMKELVVKNASSVTEFILLGLTDQRELQMPLFFLFLVNYVLALVGNLILISMICLNSHLHTPMYFFLFNLSLIDYCYSFVCTPKLLMGFFSERNIISYMGCMTQLFFFCFFVNSDSECYVLMSMAYDRYVAICNPLLYNIAMSPKVCCNVMLSSYLMAFSGTVAIMGCMLRLTFCDANTINHYFCDVLPLFQLSCISTYVNELVLFIVVTVNISAPSVTICISYGFILSSILKIKSSQGRSKAFRTCSSHIIVVSLFFGSGAFTYLKPSSGGSIAEEKISSVFFTTVIPLMNPLIYSLRNKDVKDALRKILSKRKC
ncbi:uncharacterized protein ACOB6Z_011670 [Ctenodactylus gundi]